VGVSNPGRSGRDLLRRARCCARTGYYSKLHCSFPRNNSERHSSFPRAFNSNHFNGHKLHDVVQLAGGKLPNRLPHSRGADDRVRWKRRDLKLDIEHSVQHGLHFQPTRVPDELLATILPDWKIRLAAVRSLWNTVIRVAVPLRRFPPRPRPCSAPQSLAGVPQGSASRRWLGSVRVVGD